MNPPSFSEEKLTAYALNELGPEERREVEAELAASPKLQAELKAIQSLASQLREELLLEASDFENTPFEKNITDATERFRKSPASGNSFREPDAEKIISFRKHPWFFATGLLAAAACAALMFLPIVSMSLRQASNPDPRVENETLTVSSASEESLAADAPLAMMEEPLAPPASMPEEVLVEMDSTPALASLKPASPAILAVPAEASASARGGQSGSGEKVTVTSAPKKAGSSSFAMVAETQPLHATSVYEVSSGYSVLSPAAAPTAADLKTVTDQIATKGTFVVRAEKTKTVPMKSSVSEGSTLRRVRTSSASGESYTPITDNPFLRVADQALSTFSIDVDTGAYTNLRRFLNQGQLPPPDAVRIEELVNYFNYNYPQPKGEDPFSINTEVAKAPWKNDHLLVRIGLQGKTVAVKDRPAANLVFLIDVSGSMNESNKLPLVIESMKLLVQKLKPEDRVGIAVYAGNSGMVLPSTPVSDRGEILEALSNLQAGGSTNGAMGIQLAYDMAKAHFIEGGINRVILCTDGDFNVGVTNRGDLVKLIEEKAKSKVFLSVFGFGMGNLKDDTLEQLANKGNGNYGYIDNPKEAKRVFIDQVGGTLQTIAKDVKIQVEFNPAVVASYRLIGYENRMLAARDFNDDKKDAGEIGAGHRVTALYEIVPVGAKEESPSVDPLKYQKAAPVEYAGDKSEIMNVKLRYKQPEGDTSKLIEYPVKNENIRSFTAQKSGWFRSNPEQASEDFQFAAGVAAFGMILRDSLYKGDTNFDLVLQLTGKGAADRQEDRAEFISLVKKAQTYFEEPKTKTE